MDYQIPSIYKNMLGSQSIIRLPKNAFRPTDINEEYQCIKDFRYLLHTYDELLKQKEMSVSAQDTLELDKAWKEFNKDVENLYINIQQHLEFRTRELAGEYENVLDPYKEKIYEELDKVFSVVSLDDVKDPTLKSIYEDIRKVYYVEVDIVKSISQDFLKKISYIGLPTDLASSLLKNSFIL